MRPPAGAGCASNEAAAATAGVDRATTPYREDLCAVNDSKTLILAVVLSLFVLLGWSWAANKLFPSNPPSTKIEAGKQQALPQANAQPAGPQSPRQLQNIAAVLASGPRVSIRTPSLLGSIDLKGAQIDDLLHLNDRH